MVGDSLDTTCPEVVQETHLSVNSLGIWDLTGLEHFSGLTYLDCSNNYSLDYLPELPAGLEELICRDNALQLLTNLPSTLEVLDCRSCQLDVLPELPSGLRILKCDSNSLTNIPNLPSTLEVLECNSTGLHEIPQLPPGLIRLAANYNQLDSLPPLPNTLNHLSVNENILVMIPELSDSLEFLSFEDNAVEFLPELPDGLVRLNCRENELPVLPSLPSGLNYLNCSYNELTSLPSLAESLDTLSCESNQITQLPELPEGLMDLRVFVNQLSELPEIPQVMVHLDIYGNLISTLPDTLPTNLTFLNCGLNQLSNLPSLPSTLKWLTCGGNQLTELPELPESLRKLNCGYTDISCLPILPDGLIYLTIDSTNIQCMPNLPSALLYEPTVPICEPNNVYGCPYFRKVSGTVFFDGDSNCLHNGLEIGLANRIIETSIGTFALSDSLGNYEMYLDTGSYTIWQHPVNNLWEISCPGIPYSVVISNSVDSVPNQDFPNEAVEDCHWLSVDVLSSPQRPCFNSNGLTVSYCNNGTSSVQNVYADLLFPEAVIPLSSSIPWQYMGGGLYRFDIGNLEIDECGYFNITDSVSCDAVVESTVCVTAEISPLSPCLVSLPIWDNSSLQVDGACNGNVIEFTVVNVGSASSTVPSEYRIFEDNALLNTGTISTLSVSESMVISIPSTGRTYRFELDQSAGHPGVSLPRAFVESCGPEPHSMHQILSSSQNDFDDHVEIVCVELSAAYDPNDKQVVPAGYGGSHLVHPSDSLLEYTIRFQNTGNDTAFNVIVTDTLPSEFLNPVSFLSGASSHPYSVGMHDNGIVTWRFENILLPDSTTNEPASNGFVKFKIKTRPGLSNGTVINNRANIYFDFNYPIITETCFITISDVPITASVEQDYSDNDVRIYPNPTNGLLNIDVSPLGVQPTRVSILDMTGRKVFESEFSPQIDVSRLSRGNYILEILSEKNLYSEKLIISPKR